MKFELGNFIALGNDRKGWILCLEQIIQRCWRLENNLAIERLKFLKVSIKLNSIAKPLF